MTVHGRSGFCYAIEKAPSFLPETHALQLIFGLLLIGTFLYTLKRVNIQNKRALAGAKDERTTSSLYSSASYIAHRDFSGLLPNVFT